MAQTSRQEEEIVMGKSDDNTLGYGWHCLERFVPDPAIKYRWTVEEALRTSKQTMNKESFRWSFSPNRKS